MFPQSFKEKLRNLKFSVLIITLWYIVHYFVCAASQTCGHSELEVQPGTPLSLQSPGYPAGYAKNLDCTWRITGNDVLKVVADSVDLESSCVPCDCDYLEIFDGSSGLQRESLGTWCTGNFSLFSTGQTLFIKFHTDGTGSGAGFSLTLTAVRRSEVCFKDNDTLRSNFPTFGNVECVWLLQAEPGNVVVLEVADLNYKKCSDCKCGSLVVFDGPSVSASKIGSWCHSPPSFVVSDDRYMYVRFSSKPKAAAHSFTARYKKIKKNEVCTTRGTPRDSAGVTLRSYDYSSKYLKEVKCQWLITAEAGHRVRLTVQLLDVGRCSSCDFLEVFDGRSTSSTSLGRWNSGKPDVVSLRRDMVVSFKTTSFSQTNGLIAVYRFIPESTICAKLKPYNGSLKSYEYPDKYPGNILCSWRLEARPDHLIRLVIKKLDFPECSSQQQCDYVDIFDGASTNDRKIGRYDSSIEVNIVSSGLYLTVVYRTSPLNSGSGFSGDYFSISKIEACPGSGQLKADEVNRLISSPNYPSPYWGNSNCSWHIRARAGQLVQLSVKAIDFEDCLNRCFCDYLEIFDGPSTSSHSLRKWCKSGPNLISSGRDMLIVMRTNEANSGTGFKAEYFSVYKAQVCPGSSVRDDSLGTLQSPGYPSNYPGGLTCQWTIISPPGARVRLSSNTLDLEVCSSCGCDYVEVFDGTSTESRSLGKLCSGSIDMVSTGRYLFVVFSSNTVNSGQGFELEYSTVSDAQVCPTSKTTSTTGYIQTVGYPKKYPKNLYCVWNITAPSGTVIRLVFENFPAVPRCEDIMVEAYDGGRFPFKPRCGYSLTKDLFTSEPTLLLNLTTPSKSERKGFKAAYSFVPKNVGCQGTGLLKTSTGQLISNGKSLRHNEGSLCIWQIQAPEGRKIRLSFNYVRESSCQQCSCNFVEIFDGFSPANTSFGRFCSGSPSYISNGSALSVMFWTDSGSAGEPLKRLVFKANYELLKSNADSNVKSFGAVSVAWVSTVVAAVLLI